MDYERHYEQYRAAVEDYLSALFAGSAPYDRLYDAMRYSVLSGGKRIRPVLTLEFARLGGIDWRLALPYACALELVHNYSLIHDDLPWGSCWGCSTCSTWGCAPWCCCSQWCSGARPCPWWWGSWPAVGCWCRCTAW